MEARRRGATIIHVDPRFTRTSAMANVHVPIRVGSDIAFLGGIVRYILNNERHFHEYVVNYTNAASIISDEFRDVEDLDGLFSGWDPEHGKYEVESWQYEGVDSIVPAAGHKEAVGLPGGGGPGRPRQERRLAEERDETLRHPRCVFQILKRHFARYTPEMVEQICGVPPDQFLHVAETLCANSGRDRTSAFAYAVGWTQHSVGVQYIRTASIIQLLLGNMGRPGGGILALRGHASIQGSTDIPTLYDLLPGYLPMPHATYGADLARYIEANQAATGWWSEFPKYIVSLLKAWYGDAATKDNDFCFNHIPKVTGDHSHMTTVAQMADGKLDGYFVMGENPAVGSVHGSLQRKGLRKLKWLVVRDFVLLETADFWRTGPEIESGEVSPEEIGTEVFFMPAAAHTEKSGDFTNTQRLLQWHHKAVEPQGDARSELGFMYHLGRRLKQLYAASTDPKDAPIRDLRWDYPTEGPHDEPNAEAVLAEISGYTVSDGKPVPGFAQLAADGSTASGCWIYSGAYRDGVNQTARRRPRTEQSYVAPEWAWSWPANRRLLYNRASAAPDGTPWSERKKYVWWDAGQGRWTGLDVPDFIADRAPSYRPGEHDLGTRSISGIDPFIMQADGKGWLFAPSGLLDGPLPTHYEPQESIVQNFLYRQQCNPARHEWRRRDNPYHRAFDDPRFPYLLTTFRLTEHHTAGGMSRWLSWLSELQPEMFCEVSPALAADRGLRHGGWATVTTARAEIECRVLVTRRMASLRVGGRRIEQIGLPYHWGYTGRVRGDIANDLFAFVADPNVLIPESKVATGNITAGRRAQAGAARRRQLAMAAGDATMAEAARRSHEAPLRGAGPPLDQPSILEPKS
ncbi:MAG: Formate dehydrogenase alpha subunit [Myxococcales bacterium]|nr:Formate dehydrogenase alpha subunit [Myxococcales bacterium]